VSHAADLVRAFYASHGDVTPELTETCLREEIDELLEVLDTPAFRPFGVKDEERQRKLARELADVAWCCYGHAAAAGIDLDIALEIIGRSNLAKLPECDLCHGATFPPFPHGAACPSCAGSGKGKPIKRESDSKVLRPEGWQPPNMAPALAR
jgi:NTP pyrophosphatase (non-canonical NTP hydrolase)